jgi:pimeloyl-ACP methyl ester carboxylesterase
MSIIIWTKVHKGKPMVHSDPKITKFYKDVPSEGIERLEAFRRDFPYQTMNIDGKEWCFIDSQKGESSVLMFVGGTTIAEVSMNSIEFCARKYRVIAPDYPPIDHLDELFEGYIELLDRLGIHQFSAMGGSYGGWMLQSFVRQYPERVEKAIISVVGPPNPENSKQIARILPLLRILPLGLIRSLVNRTFTGLESQRTQDPDQLMIWALVKEVVFHRLRRKDFIALMRRLVDQTENYTFTADDLVDWKGKMLIIFGSKDPATPLEKREAMRALYPQAKVVVIEGGEHGISMTEKDQYYGAIDSFLEN